MHAFPWSKHHQGFSLCSKPSMAPLAPPPPSRPPAVTSSSARFGFLIQPWPRTVTTGTCWWTRRGISCTSTLVSSSRSPRGATCSHGVLPPNPYVTLLLLPPLSLPPLSLPFTAVATCHRGLQMPPPLPQLLHASLLPSFSAASCLSQQPRWVSNGGGRVSGETPVWGRLSRRSYVTTLPATCTSPP